MNQPTDDRTQIYMRNLTQERAKLYHALHTPDVTPYEFSEILLTELARVRLILTALHDGLDTPKNKPFRYMVERGLTIEGLKIGESAA